MKIVFATCKQAPGLTASDQLLAAALERQGASVFPAPWNGPQAIFEEAQLVVIRSTWDYYKYAGAFSGWLENLERFANVANPPVLMRWNMSKAYLETLADLGVRLPPFKRVSPDAKHIAAAMDSLGLEEAIVKPLVSASAFGLSLVRRNRPDEMQKAAAALGGDGLVQQIVEEVKDVGETSILFFGGAYSHAVVKRPMSGDIRVQEEHGGVTERIEPPGWAIDEARGILRVLPEKPVYARIDVILLDGDLWLMEVEVLEPELFFTYAPEAAETLTVSLLEQLKK